VRASRVTLNEPKVLPGDRATRVFLARHGRTALNAAGLLRGRLDAGLDAVGVLQALALGGVLGYQDLQLIVSSPLVRAVETAKKVALRAGLEVEIDQRLVDRDFGPWAGKAPDAVIARWGSLNNAPDIEPELAVAERALAALHEACDRVDGGAALVVSHDAVNRLILPMLDERLDGVGTVPQDTGCFNVIERRGNVWSVLSVNNAPAGHDL
jgi:broad specificity phosphatase PhoE